MNKLHVDFIKSMMWKDTYIKDEDTAGTYNASYLGSDVLGLKKSSAERKEAIREAYQEHQRQEGCPILPCTISIAPLDVSKSGRGMKPSVGVFTAKFKACEESPYKQFKPYQVRTSVWRVEGTGCLFYGLPSISQADGKAGKDIGDLLVINTKDWKLLDVYVFRGLGVMEYQQEVVNYLKERM